MGSLNDKRPPQAVDLSVLTDKIERQAAEIERQKREIETLQDLDIKQKKEIDDLQGLQNKEIELQQTIRELKSTIEGQKEEIERAKHALNSLTEPFNRHLKGLESVANVDVSGLAGNVERLIGATEKAQEAANKAFWIVPASIIAHWVVVLVVMGAFAGGMWLNFQAQRETREALGRVGVKVNRIYNEMFPEYEGTPQIDQ